MMLLLLLGQLPTNQTISNSIMANPKLDQFIADYDFTLGDLFYDPNCRNYEYYYNGGGYNHGYSILEYTGSHDLNEYIIEYCCDGPNEITPENSLIQIHYPLDEIDATLAKLKSWIDNPPALADLVVD